MEENKGGRKMRKEALQLRAASLQNSPEQMSANPCPSSTERLAKCLWQFP